MNYKWITLFGDFEIARNYIKFKGAPSPYKSTQTGKEVIGDALGQIISNQYFSEGKLSIEVEFAGIDSKSSCEIIFFYDPRSGDYLSAGFSSAGGMFGLKSYFNEKLDFLKQVGEHVNLKPEQKYLLELELKGSQVRLFIDKVEVLSHVLPFSPKKSQVGIFCFSQSDITLKDFNVDVEKPRAFVIMQFSEQFNELYEEVIKEVSINEFGLSVIRGDEIYNPGVILSDIIKYLYESKVVIAEISPINANVFYEVGFAHALNKPTILIAEKGTQLPFDVSSFRVIFYNNTIAGKKKLQEGLRNHLNSILNQ